MTPALKLVSHDAIFRATCLATLEEVILCKFHETVYTLQSRSATCNVFKQSVHSLQNVEPSSTASISRCNFPCNLFAMVEQDKLQVGDSV